MMQSDKSDGRVKGRNPCVGGSNPPQGNILTQVFYLS